MVIHKVQQGSPEWHALRANTRNASEAPAMMGVSPHKTRSALVREKATGITEEITPDMQRRFDRGHMTEAMARPLLEAIIGEDLYPLVATDDEGYLLASSDGSTMTGDIGFEHKTWNAEFAAQVAEGNVPDYHKWQLDQQIAVFGFKKIIFVVSDGTPDNFVYCDYYPQPERIAQLKDGWKQFDADVAAYQPEVVEAKAIMHANPIDNLPALVIEVTGRVTHSNLVEFKAAANSVISSIKTDLAELVTDQDFVDAAAAVKYLKDVEDNAKRAKQNALDQTASIAELHRALDEVAAMAATVRKSLDKKITEEKDARKAEIVTKANRELSAHIVALQGRVGVLVNVSGNFADAIKGLKSLDSMRDKVSVALANAKIEANAIADRIDANIKSLKANGENWRFLFPDLQSVCTKASDDFAALLAARQAIHKETEEKRLAAEREKIRAEEQERAARIAATQAAQVIANAQHVMGNVDQAEAAGSIRTEMAGALRDVVASIATDATIEVAKSGPTMNLGQINAALGFTVTADFLAGLGVHPERCEKAAKIYESAKLETICRLIQEHLTTVIQKALGGKAA